MFILNHHLFILLRPIIVSILTIYAFLLQSLHYFSFKHITDKNKRRNTYNLKIQSGEDCLDDNFEVAMTQIENLHIERRQVSRLITYIKFSF